ncbi:hypothetical protein ONZ45_g16847 [Pleurotus djamor]|nr:hypothetical protein ONZ45_g16847 [Pleurotus djamor]
MAAISLESCGPELRRNHLTPATTFDRGLFSESPLTGEPLLSRPLPVNVPEPQTTSSSIQSANALSSLAALLNANIPSIQIPSPAAPSHTPSEEVRSPSPSPVVKLPGSNTGLPDTIEVTPAIVETVENVEAQPSPPPVMPSIPRRISPKPRALNATFIADVTVPEGQVFPPGAEFVKSWKMLNDSEHAWPKATEMVFVAGETMSRFPFVPVPVLVGSVAANSEVELSTGELKAPESPGRYVSYWRLRDENGELFGDSIWIDITVQESSSLTTSENVSPASSIIVPSKAQSAGSISQAGLHVDNASSVSPSVSPPPSTLRSFPIDEDAISEVESIASSVSLMSVPSSPSSNGFDNIDEDDDDDEAVVWEDSRSHFSNERPPATMENIEYVMLFDENSEEDI